ncbi:hypothetical protein L7F22_015985 [Adiantum nelumboides]|nr:hypothetical protein [Adiantum nelumboides]
MACLPSHPRRGSVSLVVIALVAVLQIAGMPVVLSQAGNCQGQLLTLQPCLPYVIAANNSTAPSAACCDPLRSVAASNTSGCFCQLEQFARASNINVNESRVVEIVQECDVDVPVEVSNCFGLGPALAPAPRSAANGIQVGTVLVGVAMFGMQGWFCLLNF